MNIVIFAGGVGSRLWPLSRKDSPKQFEKIIGDKSTLQLAVDRVLPLIESSHIYVSSGSAYKDVIKEQLPSIPEENFILEPVMRDVGPAVGLVAAIFEKIAPDEPLVILWSDHLVKNEDLFRKVLGIVEKLLKKEKDKIVFIGQRSRFASQNLGWIEYEDQIETVDGMPVFAFKSIHYRPNQEDAEDFHASSQHVWNPGYFGTTPRFLFSLYKSLAPRMHETLTTIADAWGTNEFEKTVSKLYPSLDKLSFDNLILERIPSKTGYVIGADLGWSDVGAWEALKEALSDNKDQNVTKGNVLLESSTDALVYNFTDDLVVGIDLQEMIIIKTPDVILVCSKRSVPKIKKLVESLKGTPYEHLA